MRPHENSGMGRATSARRYRRPQINVHELKDGRPRVVILHDHAVVAEALKTSLKGQAEVVAATPSGHAAVVWAELLMPDVIVCGDLLVDGVTEFFVPALRQTGARVLMIVEGTEVSGMLELVKLGISGLVSTGQPLDDLSEAVMVLAAGGAALPSQVVDAIASEWRRSVAPGGTTPGPTALTTRELDVLGAMSDGLSTKAVARHLGISAKTVENHKTRIFEKLGVRSQAQAVALIMGRSTGQSLASVPAT